MKMLVSEEMSKMQSEQKSSNVVARLMGLDALPSHQSDSLVKRNSRTVQLLDISSRLLQDDQHHQDVNTTDLIASNTHSYDCLRVYGDEYDFCKCPLRISQIKDQLSQKGAHRGNSNEKPVNVVRGKFVDANCLSTDEKLLQSKEFQDALELLSSNRDFFLKFLEKPDSLFSKHLHELQTVRSASKKQRITVLKPSKASHMTVQKVARGYRDEQGLEHHNCFSNHDFTNPKTQTLPPPTRIVVLKPCPGKLQNVETTPSSCTSSPGSEGLGSLRHDAAIGSSEIAEEYTLRMRESLCGKWRYEPSLSSILSNGYTGEQSSLYRSENECIEEQGGHLRDLDTDTPYSVSSFSRASYTSESSVIMEAKKRLSDRWVSNETGLGQQQLRRSPSTLGEILSIPKEKREEGSNGFLAASGGRLCGSEQDLMVPPCLSIGKVADGCHVSEISPSNISRTTPVPSSSLHNKIRLSMDVLETSCSKSVAPMEVTRSSNAKSSFREKISSLFFNRNKKPGRENSMPPSMNLVERIHPGSSNAFSKMHNCLPISTHDSGPDEFPVINAVTAAVNSPSIRVKDGSKQDTLLAKVAFPLEKSTTCESTSVNQSQLCPVAEAPFGDDVKNIYPPSQGGNARALSRSPPIESIRRSLSCEDNKLETARSKFTDTEKSIKATDEEELERFAFVQKILSSAGLNSKQSSTVIARWHSLENPLDPVLLDEFLERKKEDAKCRKRRSIQMLLFDCVNAALLEIGQCTMLRASPSFPRAFGGARNSAANALVTAEVWELVKDWSSGTWMRLADATESSRQLVDILVMREVVGRGWAESMWLVMEEFSREICGQVLDDLVMETLQDLNDSWLCPSMHL